MTPRERVLCVLNHEEPDRVPLFMGASGATSMLTPLYEKFKTHFGIGGPTRFLSRPSQQVMIDERHSRPLGRRWPADCARSPDFHAGQGYIGGLSRRRLRNHLAQEAGQHLLRDPRPSLAQCHHRRSRAVSLAGPGASVAIHPSPRRGRRRSRNRGRPCCCLSGRASSRRPTKCGAWSNCSSIWREMKTLPRRCWRRLEKLFTACLVAALREVGQYVDIVITGDDVANQAGPMMSPAMYRRLIKPHHARMFAAIRENTKAKIYLHSCGNVYRLIGDFIEMGVQLLNPVQVSAGEMGDTAPPEARIRRSAVLLGRHRHAAGAALRNAGRRAGGSAAAHPRFGPRWRLYRRRGTLYPARRADGKRAGNVRRSVESGTVPIAD